MLGDSLAHYYDVHCQKLKKKNSSCIIQSISTSEKQVGRNSVEYKIHGEKKIDIEKINKAQYCLDYRGDIQGSSDKVMLNKQ